MYNPLKQYFVGITLFILILCINIIFAICSITLITYYWDYRDIVKCDTNCKDPYNPLVYLVDYDCYAYSISQSSDWCQSKNQNEPSFT